MSFPAYDQFGQDIRVGFATWRVYMRLRPPRLDFAVAREVKVWALASELSMSPRKVRASLNWLVENGYLISHGLRDGKVRCLRLAYLVERPERPAA